MMRKVEIKQGELKKKDKGNNEYKTFTLMNEQCI